MKKCWTSLVIRKMEIKTAIRNHFICTRIATTKKNTHVGEDVEQQELALYMGDRSVKWFNRFGWLAVSYKVKAIPFQGIHPREMKHGYKKIYTRRFTAVFLYNR